MRRVLVITAFVCLISAAFAQSKKDAARFIPNITVVADGDLSDWQGRLQSVGNEEAGWAYAIGYDRAHLYLAVKVLDPALQLEAAVHGISVGINMQGKKKEEATLLFPVPDGETIRAMAAEKDMSSKNTQSELLRRSRGFGVKGFPRIVDGLISIHNGYGVKAVAIMDENDHLVYESIIPLAQLKDYDPDKAIAVKVAVENRWSQGKETIRQTPVSRSPHAGRGTMSRPVVKSPFKGKTAIWVVDKLPKK